MKEIIFLLIFFSSSSFLFAQEIKINKDGTEIMILNGNNYKKQNIACTSFYVDTVKNYVYLLNQENDYQIDNLGCPCKKQLSIYQYSNQGEFILKYNNVINLKSIKSKWYHIDAIDKISFNPFFKIDIDNKGIIRSEIILESSSIIFKNTDTSIDGIIKSFELLSDFLKKNRKYLRLQNIKIRETRWHNR